RRSPALTIVAVLTLALGIGANTAIFSVVDGVLLKPLPYKDPDRLLIVWEKPPGGGNNVVSTANFLDWKQQNHVFEAMAASGSDVFNLTEAGEPDQIVGRRVSANFFQVLGQKPILGRTFLPDEEQSGKDKVVVLTHRLWQQRFGADRGIIGRALRLNGETYSVVGILAPYFSKDFPPSLWAPLPLSSPPSRDFHFLAVV